MEVVESKKFIGLSFYLESTQLNSTDMNMKLLANQIQLTNCPCSSRHNRRLKNDIITIVFNCRLTKTPYRSNICYSLVLNLVIWESKNKLSADQLFEITIELYQHTRQVIILLDILIWVLLAIQ